MDERIDEDGVTSLLFSGLEKRKSHDVYGNREVIKEPKIATGYAKMIYVSL